MNAMERNQIQKIKDDANRLMDSKPMVNPVVRNVDIIEALIGDLGAIGSKAYPPHNVADLVKLAEDNNEL